ncbi:putative tail fiber protein [Vibrio phage vB_VspS_VS-ABTNL-3]|nr:putative tail fiber protein [Vibrio phage vB_VspS_VS-ABTNL-3]
MGLENTHPDIRPDEFNVNWPEGTDDQKYGDDHIRLVKLGTYNFWQDFEKFKVDQGDLFTGSKAKEAIQADNAAKLNNEDPDKFARIDGNYSKLRAQATTKDDVGLSRVPNYYISNSSNSGSTTNFASSYAVKGAYDLAKAANDKANSPDGYNGIGSYCMAMFEADRVYPPQGGANTIVAGSRLYPAGFRRDSNGRVDIVYESSTKLSGSWCVMGMAYNYFPSQGSTQRTVSLFVRVS